MIKSRQVKKLETKEKIYHIFSMIYIVIFTYSFCTISIKCGGGCNVNTYNLKALIVTLSGLMFIYTNSKYNKTLNKLGELEQ